ncbi:MAG: phosphoribosyltransferase family protein [Candidatus Bipolaricaulota bacterium]
METHDVRELVAEIRTRIRRDSLVLSSEFLRVDGFLNHRVEPEFVALAGAALATSYADAQVSCVFTAEAAGNVIAYEAARRLDAAALYAKKGAARTMERALMRRMRSPTKGTEQNLCVSADYLGPEQRVLVVDDFLHQGTTSAALAAMVAETGAQLVGFGFVIEKRQSRGRQALQRFGVPIVSLAIIESMDPGTGQIVFAEK